MAYLTRQVFNSQAFSKGEVSKWTNVEVTIWLIDRQIDSIFKDYERKARKEETSFFSFFERKSRKEEHPFLTRLNLATKMENDEDGLPPTHDINGIHLVTLYEIRKENPTLYHQLLMPLLKRQNNLDFLSFTFWLERLFEGPLS